MRDMTVCFALATLHLQKRDERRDVNRLARGDGGDEGASSVAVKAKGSTKIDDQDGGH